MGPWGGSTIRWGIIGRGGGTEARNTGPWGSGGLGSEASRFLSAYRYSPKHT